MNSLYGSTLRGRVVEGMKRGRRLGFPTANIHLDSDCVPPDSGIYACRVMLCASMRVHDATMSVGDNPTFGDVRESQVEAHLHDVAVNLYGQVIEIRIVQRIRDMITFETVDDLIFNTAQDVVRSREILSAATRDGSS